MSALAGSLPETYAEHRTEVLRALSRKCRWLDPVDREALFQEAVVLLLEKDRAGELDISAMEHHQVRAYLLRAAIFNALDEYKRAERRLTVSHDAEPGLQVADEGPTADEELQRQYQRARLDEILAEMPDRRSAVIKLRFFFERTPAEIQTLLRISERAYRKELEAGMQQLSQHYAVVRSGKWCEQRRSSVLALVAGVAGPNRSRLARQHLRSCPGCARWAAELRTGAREAAALLPMPAVVASNHPGRTAEWLTGVRDVVADAAVDVKHRLLILAGRADPAAMASASGARPGATAAVLSACLAIGGGATYCGTQLLPVTPKPKPERRAAATTTPAPTAASTPRAVATTSPRPVATPVRRQATPSPAKQAPRRTAAERRREAQERERIATAPEFGLEGSGVPEQTTSAPVAPPAPTPAPGPPGEFDP